MSREIENSLKLQKQADVIFMALTLWREARGELITSMNTVIGVAFTIMNRALNPKWWGRDITSVVFKPWQFSSLTDPKDKQLTTWPNSKDNSWKLCMQIASDVIAGNLQNTVGKANHYYDISISPPKWADESKLVIQIGKIKFYNL